MSTNSPVVIQSSNLSLAWGKAFLQVMRASPSTIDPLTITVSGFNGLPAEDKTVKGAVDAALIKFNKVSAKVSAFTIFPESYWRSIGSPGCRDLSDGYLTEILPRMRAQNKLNRYGTYFERMVAFNGTIGRGKKVEPKVTNQLAHIIELWRNLQKKGTRPRHSALVISCFDPAKDHTGQHLRGFPCLAQVSLGYDGDGGLSLSAFYPTQYLFDRAYGNYLGLAHLGQFMANEMGLTLVRLNFFIGRPELGIIAKKDLAELVQHVEAAVKTDSEASNGILE